MQGNKHSLESMTKDELIYWIEAHDLIKHPTSEEIKKVRYIVSIDKLESEIENAKKIFTDEDSKNIIKYGTDAMDEALINQRDENLAKWAALKKKQEKYFKVIRAIGDKRTKIYKEYYDV